MRTDTSQDSEGAHSPAREEAAAKTYEGKMWELWKYKTLRRNLLVLVLCWAACSFGFYMLVYILKYIKGNIFVNAYAAAFAETAGKLSTVIALHYAPLKRVFLISLSLSLIGILLLIVFGQNGTWVPLMLLIAKFGLSQAFVTSYLSVVLLYPTILASTTMGICNLLARVATTMAPMAAEIKAPFGLAILFVVVGSALLASQFLVMPAKPDSNRAAKVPDDEVQ